MSIDWAPFWISLRSSLVATAITLVLGLAAARWRVNSQARWRFFVDGILLLPLVLPPTVVGLLLLLAFGRRGLLGDWLARLDLTLVFTWPATVLAAAVVAFPLMYYAARGALAQVDASFVQAARTLGAGEWRIFLRVVLPLAWPGVLAGTILTFARALGEFGATLMVAGSIPGRTQTAPVAIFFAVEAGDTRLALVLSLLLIAISFAALAALGLLTHSAGWARPRAGRR